MTVRLVVLDRDHADDLFPEPDQADLRAACHEVLGPCLVLLSEEGHQIHPLDNGGDLVDLGNAPAFPWRTMLSETAVARALGEFFGEIDASTVEVDPAGRLDRLDDPKDFQLTRASNCIQVPVKFMGPGGHPVIGVIQVSVFVQEGLLTLQVGGQPTDFKPPEPEESLS